ncbi:hypothetical protein B0O99DRAFT_578626 [Bisporella sp. PMI_857]|nr:hypothetical protein B0O99DRAFT_578626 [Bisporella sp. PMI_857]
MNELARISLEDFHDVTRKSQMFDSSYLSHPLLATISILQFADEPAKCSSGNRTMKELDGFINRAYTSRLSASFKLIYITRSTDNRLAIGEGQFLNLVKMMGIDQGVLHLVGHEYDGFHRIPDEGAETCYLGTSHYALFWTYSYTSCTSHAILINRLPNYLPRLTAFFESNKHYIHSPVFVPYVASLYNNDLYDTELKSNQIPTLKWLESRVRHGPTSYHLPMNQRYDMNDLTNALQFLGRVQCDIANIQRHLRLFGAVKAFLRTKSGQDLSSVNAEARSAVEKSTEYLLEALDLLSYRADASNEYLIYLTVRAERLSAVIFALLTHEDSAINADLANSSRELAAAAKRDSSSMKTIAVMTMIFLPGTFFAALFSVPSLKWDGEYVIQDRFWVYWVFTLPATFIVILVWFVLTNWEVSWRTEKRTKKEVSKLK